MLYNFEKGIDYPEWMTEESLKTLKRQHLNDNETPKEMYLRIVNTLGNRLEQMCEDYPLSKEIIDVEFIKSKWFDFLWKGWLCPSTPILSNVGTDRKFGISCYILRLKDTLDSIYQKVHEMAILTKSGGGVGVTFDKIRGRGEVISTGGFSEGIIPFVKVYDSAIVAASQGNIRRGSASINLPIRHKDINEFLNIRLPIGDVNRQCLNINHCVTIDDYFMEDVIKGNEQARDIWAKVLSTRMKTGEPYIMYYHNVHNQRPDDMKKRNLKIDGSNICSEILLPHDDKHTVVCDLSSLNLSKWDEWKDNDELIELSLLFLDVNLEEFIVNAKNKVGFENAVRFAKKARALGLGVLGFHSLLQQKMLPFVSIATRSLITMITKKLQKEGTEYNLRYGSLFESPEWCDENRNLTLFAIAPTMTNAIISGGVSNGIEPFICNIYAQKSAKGTFIRKNKHLEELLETKYKEYNTSELWNNIMTEHKGSIQHLDFLTNDEKEVFLTAYEINQLELIKNAVLWQKVIDQGISLNLFFPNDVDPKWLNKCHIEAWQEGIKTLYYVRTESILSKDMKSSTFDDCTFCEG
jgi:ribonucleoside-diphosphate reductase alpha chain